MPSILPPILHPLVVHFPIVLMLLAALVAVLYRRITWASPALLWLLILAAASSLVSIATGWQIRTDSREAWEGTAKIGWILVHQVLGFIVAGISVVMATGAIILYTKNRPVANIPVAIVLVVAALLVSVTGWYGGAIVWDELPDEAPADQLGSRDGTNPFVSPSPTPTEPADNESPVNETQGGESSGSDPPNGPNPTPPASGCETFAPGAETEHTGGYNGFYGADTGVAGDGGLPIWELSVVSGTSGGNHYYNDLEGNKVNTIKVPVCREVRFSHYNEGGAKHDLDIGDWQKKDPFVVDTRDLSGGETTTGSFEVEVTGSVAFYCSVGKHASMGQRGTFTVAELP